MGGKRAGRKDADKDREKTMRKLRDAVQEEEGDAIKETERKAKQAFRDKKKGKK